MAELKTQVEIGGQKHDVTLDTGALGVYTQEEVREGYLPKELVEKTLIPERVARATKGKFGIDDLASDEAALKTIAEKYRDPILGVLGVKPGKQDVDLTAAQETWRTTEVKPLQTQLEAAATEISNLRVERLRNEIATAANEFGIIDGLLPLVKAHYEGIARWNDDHRGYFMPDGKDGFAITTNPANDKAPYLTVSEDLAAKAQDPKYASWFKAQSRDGMGVRGFRPKGGKMTVEEFEKLSGDERAQIAQTNPAEYAEMMGAIQARNEQNLLKRTGGFF